MIRLSERLATCPARPPQALLIALAAIFTIVSQATPSSAATSADTAATHALLQARYELDLALLRNTPAASAAVGNASQRIGGECHDVLAGAPNEYSSSSSGQAPSTETPRARGERERAADQQLTLVEELSSALSAAELLPVHAPIEALLATTARLSWSDARIAALVQAESAALQEDLTAPPPDVCADMKAWAASGYRTLSPASRAFEATLKAREQRVAPGESLPALLKPNEGPAELALVHRTDALRTKLTARLVGGISRAYRQVQRVLGVPEGPDEERERGPVLGHGTTRSGATFTVRPGHSNESSCRHQVSVELAAKPNKNGTSGGSSTGGLCISSGARARPSGSCGDGEASVDVVVPNGVRTVRLRLSDTSTITSTVVRVPRKDGGPAGVYVQAVRGYRAYPVSLEELDRGGHVVRVLRLRNLRCKKAPEVRGPRLVDLVHGELPGGGPFTIQGAVVEYPPHGHDFSLITAAGEQSGSEESNSEISVGAGARSPRPKAYAWSLATACGRASVLVYGILKQPGASVLARTPEGVTPLTIQALAPELHSGGPLVYGAFASIPSELVVRRADGSTLYSESLTARATTDREFCEGRSEAG